MSINQVSQRPPTQAAEVSRPAHTNHSHGANHKASEPKPSAEVKISTAGQEALKREQANGLNKSDSQTVIALNCHGLG